MIFQKALITQVNEKDYTAKVKLVDMQYVETDFLPIITPVAIGNKNYNLPKVDSLVIALIQHKGSEGVILGSLYNDIDQPPSGQKHIFKQEFDDGSAIEYNNNTGVLSIDAKQNIKIKTQNTIELSSQTNIKIKDNIELTGNVKITGTLDVMNKISTLSTIDAVGVISSSADVKAGITTLKTHIHSVPTVPAPVVSTPPIV